MKKNELMNTIVAKANGIGECYNFTSVLTAKAENKANGYKFTQLKRDYFTLNEYPFSDYAYLVDELQHALYNGKGGATQLEKVASFLGLDIDIKKVARNLVSRKVNVNRIDKTSEAYKGYEALQNDLADIEAKGDLTPLEKAEALASKRKEIEAFKNENAVFTTASVFQLSPSVFRMHLELELSSYLASTNTYADFRTLKERTLDNKTWRTYLAKAEFYGIDATAYINTLDVKALKKAVKACFKVIAGTNSDDNFVTRWEMLGVKTSDFKTVKEYIEAIYSKDSQLFAEYYGKESAQTLVDAVAKAIEENK